jgi:ribonuclease HIII
MAKKPVCFVVKIDLKKAETLRKGLLEKGFQLSSPPYTLFSGKKKGVSCTLYESGKMTIQGKDKDEFIEFYIEPEILGDFQYTYRDDKVDMTARIGVDEAGKGDFFGPLCVAGVHANEEQIKKLVELGVADSKKINDKRIAKLAIKIKEICAHQIVVMNPLKYNELYIGFGNLNKLLAWGHATVIEALFQKTECSEVIIDQFAAEHVVSSALQRKNLQLNLTQRHRGEEDVVVAAASILARDSFVFGLAKLGQEINIELPKGAGAPVLNMGMKLYNMHGAGFFQRIAKTHFKTYSQIIGEGL